MVNLNGFIDKKLHLLDGAGVFAADTRLQKLYSEAFLLSQQSIFDNLDTDDNKQISNEELFAIKEMADDKKQEITSDLNNIFKELDKDGDGKVSDEELKSFEESGEANLKTDFLKKLMVMMGLKVEGEDTIKTELDAIESELNALETTTEETTSDTPVAETSGAQNTGGNSSGGGGGNGNVNLNTNGSTQKPKTIEEYKEAIKTKEAEKKEVQAQAEEEIADEEANIQKAMEDAASGLTAEQIQEYNAERDKIKTEITKQDEIINSTTTTLQADKAKLDAIPAQISAYDGQIANLRSMLTSGTTEEDKDKNKRINDKIDNLTKEKEKKVQEQKDLEAKIKADTQTLETAQAEKTRLETEQDELLNKFLEENKNVIPQEIQDTIKESQTKIQTLRSERETKTNSLNTEIQTLKNELAVAEAKQESDTVIDKNKESNFDANGNRIGIRKMPSTPEEYAKYGLDSPKKIERFEKCHQQSKEAMIDLLDYAMEQGMEVKITSSLRTYDEQVSIYNGGANPLAAKPGTSMHESGQAFDISISGGDRDNPNDPLYRKLGEIWAKKGYRWGGYWKNQCEPWHFDTKGSF